MPLRITVGLAIGTPLLLPYSAIPCVLRKTTAGDERLERVCQLRPYGIRCVEIPGDHRAVTQHDQGAAGGFGLGVTHGGE